MLPKGFNVPILWTEANPRAEPGASGQHIRCVHSDAESDLYPLRGIPDPGSWFVYDDSEWESDYALEKICKAISVAFGVSFTAAKIHLKELGLLMKANRYNTPQALQAV